MKLNHLLINIDEFLNLKTFGHKGAIENSLFTLPFYFALPERIHNVIHLLYNNLYTIVECK